MKNPNTEKPSEFGYKESVTFTLSNVHDEPETDYPNKIVCNINYDNSEGKEIEDTLMVRTV